jgi:hypothetical protein
MNLPRREFLKRTVISGVSAPFVLPHLLSQVSLHESEFCKHLKAVGRILEMQGYYVWCNSPIAGPDGKIHVFFSRWEEKFGMGGWISHCEIAHAVADSPESSFEFVDVSIKPRKGYFDATTCHNPHIQFIEGKYCLFYMGNSNARTNTKRIGLALSDSLYGPWERHEHPLLDVSPAEAWDDHCTTNPAFVRHPNGQYWLYYKSWNTQEYEAAPKADRIKGNRKYGLAIAERLEGPYIKYKDNPVIDFSSGGDNRQLEDAFVWIENGTFKLIARDMGFFNHKVGLYLESKDGINWSPPQIAYWETDHYIKQPPAPDHLSRYGRFERPQLLMKNAKPSYLFTTSQGGKYMTASGFVFRIE